MEEKITAQQAADKWGIALRRVQDYCKKGRIPGAERFGLNWMIPKDAQKPIDARTRAGREAKYSPDRDMPLPRKTPFLYMTDLYNTPGCADEAIAALADNHEAQVLLAAEFACAKGDIDKVYENANYLLEKHSGFYAILAGGTLLAKCAIWKGDLNMWRKAKIHISEAPAKDDREREILTLSICAVDSMLYDVKNFPKWFKIGCFELLHKDSLPAARVYYAKYLYAVGCGIAAKTTDLEGVSGLSLMALLPGTIEPMISWSVADQTVISEIYLRLTCAVTYHYAKNDQQAVRHIDKALALALPDKLYGILAEYCRTIGVLLEQRVKLAAPEAWNEINRLYRVYVANWTKLGSKITGRQIVEKLSDQYRVVARLAAFKMSDAEIAARTNMSISGVKQAIRTIKEKSGLERADFAAIL